MTVPAPIAHTIQQTQIWLKELRDNAELADEATAFSVLRAVLHQLRDRLSIEEAADLAAQLPILTRGIYFEGWQPAHVPQKIRWGRFPSEIFARKGSSRSDSVAGAAEPVAG